MNLEPKAAEEKYYFATVEEDDLRALTEILDSIVCVFREEEALTVVFSEDVKADIEESSEEDIQGPFAMITMTVQTDLNAIGILAKITAELAKEKIAVNAFSAYHHDHIFVPYDKKDAAVALIKPLSF